MLVVTLTDAGCVALDKAGTAVSQPAYPIQQIDATGVLAVLLALDWYGHCYRVYR